ncbi:TPA: helix-turn-helix transcriptional regulator, partial [Legionella pneumophila]|nr:helix-turn-helix transcriptional regulator [Legionella pneumophila]
RTGFGAARIGNWEQGTRSPGPEEALVLSKELVVAASWLLGISNDPHGEWMDHVIFEY